MLAVSTSWQSPIVSSGEELLARIKRLGVEGVELEYRITPRMFDEMLPILKANQLATVSIHNYFPVPEEIGRGGGDTFRLSADDPDERELAVKYTGRAIEIAGDLDAQAVVLHLGKVNVDPRMDALRDLYDRGELGSDMGEALIGLIKAEREAEAPHALDRVLDSLEKINQVAEREQVLLGLENRYYPHEIPNGTDLEVIFFEFANSQLRYWHDVGHAAVQENLGLASQEELLSAQKDRLLGIHLHDARGYDDHLAPGAGDVDFHRVKDYVGDAVIKVVEVQPAVSEEELRASLDFLAEAGLA